MYLERYIIVTGSFAETACLSIGVCTIHWVEAFILLGSFAFFCLLYVLASRVIPTDPGVGGAEGQLSHSRRRIGERW